LLSFSGFLLLALEGFKGLGASFYQRLQIDVEDEVKSDLLLEVLTKSGF